MDFDLEQLKASNLRTQDNAAYQRVHIWIARQCGKASMCSDNSDHKSTRYHWANISGEYKYETSDWKQLCPSCHTKSDYTEARRRIMRFRSLGNTSHNIPVIAVNPKKKVSYSYASAVEAAKHTGISRKNISNVLRGWSKTAGGYRWRYGEVCH